MLIMDQQRQGRPVQIETETDPPGLELYIDEKQVSQVLVNLGKNALQALEGRENGRIKITAATNAQGRKFIRVADNGPGISPELTEEIFVPFFTTKTGGTGIGLSLSKQIMHRHGGNLSVHSQPDSETWFTLTF